MNKPEKPGKAAWPLLVSLPPRVTCRREPVRVELVDGGRVDGTIEAVGSDYLELAEHAPGEARRRAAVTARRFLRLAAVAAVTLPRARR
jgi:hypothetical protein